MKIVLKRYFIKINFFISNTVKRTNKTENRNDVVFFKKIKLETKTNVIPKEERKIDLNYTGLIWT